MSTRCFKTLGRLFRAVLAKNGVPFSLVVIFSEYSWQPQSDHQKIHFPNDIHFVLVFILMFECHSDILRTEGQGERISGVVRKMMGFCTSVDVGIGVSLLTPNHIPWVQGASPLSLKLSANYNRVYHLQS